jgi:hypothetical protein
MAVERAPPHRRTLRLLPPVSRPPPPISPRCHLRAFGRDWKSGVRSPDARGAGLLGDEEQFRAHGLANHAKRTRRLPKRRPSHAVVGHQFHNVWRK